MSVQGGNYGVIESLYAVGSVRLGILIYQSCRALGKGCYEKHMMFACEPVIAPKTLRIKNTSRKYITPQYLCFSQR